MYVCVSLDDDTLCILYQPKHQHLFKKIQVCTCMHSYHVQYIAQKALQSSQNKACEPLSWALRECLASLTSHSRPQPRALSFAKWSRIVYVHTSQSICAFASSSQKPFAKAYSPDVHEKPVHEAREYLANWSAREESWTDRERFAKFFVQRTVHVDLSKYLRHHE